MQSVQHKSRHASQATGAVTYQVEGRAIWGFLLNRCGPHPEPLRAWPVRWTDHEATALPQKLVEDVRLALHGEEAAASASAGTQESCLQDLMQSVGSS